MPVPVPRQREDCHSTVLLTTYPRLAARPPVTHCRIEVDLAFGDVRSPEHSGSKIDNCEESHNASIDSVRFASLTT